MAKSTARELPITVKLPSFLLREIGRVVIHYAVLEWKLSRITYMLLGIDPVAGRISVREPRSTDRLDMIVDLLKPKKISVKADLPAIRDALDACSKQRDVIAHGLWIKDPNYLGKLFLRVLAGNWTPPGESGKHKRRIHPQAHEYSADDAKNLLELINATTHEVFTLENEIKVTLDESQYKRR